MNTKDALIRTLKYQLVALVPTILGIGIIILGFYLMFIDAVLDINQAVNQNGVEWVVDNQNQVAKLLRSQMSPFIGLIMMIVGYFTHKFGRMFVFMRMEIPKSKDPVDRNEVSADLLVEPDEETNDF